MEQVHLIWGKVEANSSSTEGSGTQGSAGGRSQDGDRRKERLIRRYAHDQKLKQALLKVAFQDPSSSSESPQPTPEAKRSEGIEVFNSAGGSQESQDEEVAAVVQVPEPPSPSAELPAEGTHSTGFSRESLLEAVSMWSRGSALHAEGKCRPCHYVHTAVGCLNSRDCEFCHLPHTAKGRPRPCKTRRQQCQRLATMLEEEERVKATSDKELADFVKSLSSKSSYMRGIIRKQQKANACASSSSSHAEQPSEARPAPRAAARQLVTL